MKSAHFVIAFALMLLSTGCINDDTDFGDIINGKDQPQDIQPIDIALDFTPLTEDDDVAPDDPSDPAYNDYVENSELNRVVYLEWNGDQVTASGNTERVTLQQDGAHVTIYSSASRMCYVLNGTSANGSFKIYSDHKFQLTLNGLDLTNPNGAPINNQGGKSLYLVLNDGTINHLADGENYQVEAGEQMKGAFFSEGQILVSGKGQLNINARGGHGFVSDDYIRFRPGCNLYVSCSGGNGIKSNDGIIIDGGVINVEVSADGAKGIKCDSTITVNGGRTTVITSGATLVTAGVTTALNDSSSCAAIRCDSTMTVNGGLLLLKSTGEGGKGINCTTNLIIHGGKVQVVTLGEKLLSSPKGIKSDASITINGGYVYSYSAASDPIDAATNLIIGNTYTLYESLPRRFIVSYE